ncbi:MAG: hypothetical protein LBM01_03250 [Christensenellaceae bacterium]|jgi:hypothetical protein|nr:hypothetical protein [Christensenellaceae bacterium]
MKVAEMKYEKVDGGEYSAQIRNPFNMMVARIFENSSVETRRGLIDFYKGKEVTPYFHVGPELSEELEEEFGFGSNVTRENMVSRIVKQLNIEREGMLGAFNREEFMQCRHMLALERLENVSDKADRAIMEKEIITEYYDNIMANANDFMSKLDEAGLEKFKRQGFASCRAFYEGISQEDYFYKGSDKGIQARFSEINEAFPIKAQEKDTIERL